MRMNVANDAYIVVFLILAFVVLVIYFYDKKRLANRSSRVVLDAFPKSETEIALHSGNHQANEVETTENFYCKNCGIKLSQDARFCENCGQSLN